MKFLLKYIKLSSFLFLGFFLKSCESDDICADKVITPRLIVRFMDKDQQNRAKAVNNFLIYGENRTEAISFSTTDSVVLPLKMKENLSKFILVKDAVFDSAGNLTSGDETSLIIKYTPEESFLDKGCGFRVIYKEISVEKPSTSWIFSTKTLFNNIEDEKRASFHIFH